MTKYFEGFSTTFTDRTNWTLPKILKHQADHRPDSVYLEAANGQVLTFSEADRESSKLANGLADAGVKFGDRVPLLLPNSLDYFLIWFALNKLGALAVPLNTAYSGSFLEHPLNNTRATLMVSDTELAQAVIDSEDRLDHLTDIYLMSSPAAAGGDLIADHVAMHAYDSLISSNEEAPNVEVAYYDNSLIIFTGGTTGASKGVVMPHAHAYMLAEAAINAMRLDSTDINVTAFPLFHGNALVAAGYGCMIRGARLVVYERFSASQWLARMRKHKATVTHFVGATLDFVYKQPPTSSDKDNCLRLVYAAPIPDRIEDQFLERFGVEKIVSTYGQTEVGMPIICPHGEKRPAGAVGKLNRDYFEARIVDPQTDEELKTGQLGEMVFRPKLPWITCSGYNNNPEGTLKVMRNHWWHTGDGVRVDEDGWYSFIDRTNDALRVRGENVSSHEVEEAILQHHGVVACAVVAVPAEFEGGEHEVKACLVLRDTYEFRYEDFIVFCEAALPFYAVPRYVEIMVELPMTKHGTIQKAKLRTDGISAATWDRVEAGVQLQHEVARSSRSSK